jgi:hypothetical protein
MEKQLIRLLVGISLGSPAGGGHCLESIDDPVSCLLIKALEDGGAPQAHLKVKRPTCGWNGVALP